MFAGSWKKEEVGGRAGLPEPNSGDHLVTSWEHVKVHRLVNVGAKERRPGREAWRVRQPSSGRCGDWVSPFCLFISVQCFLTFLRCTVKKKKKKLKNLPLKCLVSGCFFV